MKIEGITQHSTEQDKMKRIFLKNKAVLFKENIILSINRKTSIKIWTKNASENCVPQSFQTIFEDTLTKNVLLNSYYSIKKSEKFGWFLT